MINAVLTMNKDNIEIIRNYYLSKIIESPLKFNAIEITNAEKIDWIKGHFDKTTEHLGWDLC